MSTWNVIRQGKNHHWDKPMTDENYRLPEISPRQLADWLQTRPQLVLLDVREENEAAYSPFPDPRVLVVPLSRLARLQEKGLPSQVNPAAEIVVFCHVGGRSSQVVYWLNYHLGYPTVYNLHGGIDAYADQIDPQIPRYA
jgi:rhodanese-related sulfurtransferase